MEEDIQNYSPTVMFRGTPCILYSKKCVSLTLKNDDFMQKKKVWQSLLNIVPPPLILESGTLKFCLKKSCHLVNRSVFKK